MPTPLLKKALKILQELHDENYDPADGIILIMWLISALSVFTETAQEDILKVITDKEENEKLLYLMKEFQKKAWDEEDISL